MKRRKFLQGMMAGAATTAMPLPAIAKVATATTAKVVPFHYGWACVYAQMNGGVSAADIERVFRVSPDDATGLMNRMLDRGVIRPWGLDGKSQPTRAWEPWDKKSAPVESTAREDTTPDAPHKRGTRARAKFQTMINAMKSEPEYLVAA